MQNTSFNHSVKVPKLYKCAAKISQEVAGGSASIKQLVYEKTHFNTKALYALVVTTFQKAKEIDLLLKRTELLENEPRLDPWLAKILISEVLWGKKQLPNSDAKPIQTILAYEQAFYAHLSDSSEDAPTVKPTIYKKPRYVRINTLINPFNEALELFQEEGWNLQTSSKQNDYTSFLEQVSNLEGDFMLKDMHIPDLLIFPCGTEFYNHPGYKKGALVLQDKASCLPVHLLSPPPGSVVLDMCAAPGMKTTQLATMLQNEGTVYAVERDPKRFDVLNKMVESSGATCIKTILRDVLQCGDADFPDVDYILVDPSCSASGMTDRLELQQNRDPERLQKLAGFQIKILRSALTRYPKVKKVVYSTCSLYPEENEDVVRQVLESNSQFKLVPADQFINKAWKNFASPDFGDIGKYCLYARPEDDLTNGFFVAVFERLEEEENNQFFNGRVLNYRKNVEQKLARKERKYREQFEGGNNFEISEDKNREEFEGGNNLEISQDKTVNDGKLVDTKEDDVEVDSGVHKEAITYDDAYLKKTKKHERKSTDVAILEECENENYKEFAKKEKKKRRKHAEIANDTQAVNENNRLTETEEIENELTDESHKKKEKKKKKRKDTEECGTIDESVVLESPNGTEINENKSSLKDKKKRRGELMQNVDRIDYEVAEKKDKLTKKYKKEKNKHSDLGDLEVPSMKEAMGELIHETLKKSKKRNVGEDKNLKQTCNELINDTLENKQDVTDTLTSKTSKKSERKKKKDT